MIRIPPNDAQCTKYDNFCIFYLRYYPDWQEMCDTLDMNTHIPKPVKEEKEPEKVEQQKEEEKKEEDKEKVWNSDATALYLFKRDTLFTTHSCCTIFRLRMKKKRRRKQTKRNQRRKRMRNLRKPSEKYRKRRFIIRMINIRFIPLAERLKGRIIIAPCFSFLATSFSSQNYFSNFFFRVSPDFFHFRNKSSIKRNWCKRNEDTGFSLSKPRFV